MKQVIKTTTTILLVIFAIYLLLVTPQYISCEILNDHSLGSVLVVEILIIIISIYLFHLLDSSKEFLIAIAVIFILITAIGVFITGVSCGHPIKDSNNAQRWSEINSLASATSQYIIDNAGQLPKCTSNPDYEIPEIAICLGTGSECCDLYDSLVTGKYKYMTSIPMDPMSGNEANTGYLIWQEKGTVDICVEALLTYEDEEIKVCR